MKLYFLCSDLAALGRWGFAKCISVKATIKIIAIKNISKLTGILLLSAAERNLGQKLSKHNTLKIHRLTVQQDTWEQPHSLNKYSEKIKVDISTYKISTPIWEIGH